MAESSSTHDEKSKLPIYSIPLTILKIESFSDSEMFNTSIQLLIN